MIRKTVPSTYKRKELEPSIQVFITDASRRGWWLVSKREISCQESAVELRTPVVVVAKLKASSPTLPILRRMTETGE